MSLTIYRDIKIIPTIKYKIIEFDKKQKNKDGK